MADSLGEEGVPPADPERDSEQDAGQAEWMHQLSESDAESVRQTRRQHLVLQFDPDPAPSQGDVEGPHADKDELLDGTGVPLTSSALVGLESLDDVNLERVGPESRRTIVAR